MENVQNSACVASCPGKYFQSITNSERMGQVVHHTQRKIGTNRRNHFLRKRKRAKRGAAVCMLPNQRRRDERATSSEWVTRLTSSFQSAVLKGWGPSLALSGSVPLSRIAGLLDASHSSAAVRVCPCISSLWPACRLPAVRAHPAIGTLALTVK